MDVSQKKSDEQAALWNGSAGQAWVEQQSTLDQMFKPFEDLLVEVAGSKPRAHVLDVGCGTGATTLALKKRLGAECQCTGVDISEPMLARARATAERDGIEVNFLRADAEFHAFERGSFDLIVSRFGVMFFQDSVRALANLRHAAQDGAELCLLVWRGPSENPFMTAAEHAAAAILPNIPARQPDVPGQFGFADSTRVARFLEQSGWSDIDIRPLDVACTFPEKDMLGYATHLGPLSRILREVDDQTKRQVLAAVRTAFDPYVHGATVRFGAACWRINARA